MTGTLLPSDYSADHRKHRNAYQRYRENVKPELRPGI